MSSVLLMVAVCVVAIFVSIPAMASLNRAERKTKKRHVKLFYWSGKGLGLLLVFFAFGLLFTFLYVAIYPQLVANTIGCKYFDRYYTNTTFMHDVSSIISNHKGLVCRHIAPTIMCLCRAYNETCEYYTEMSYNGGGKGELMEHIGVRYLLHNGNSTEWVGLM